MTEHEKLKEICEEIGYKWKLYTLESVIDDIVLDTYCKIRIDINVREIIFTQEFMDLLAEYYCNMKKQIYIEWWRPKKIADIIHHLDNPVDYLYNILNLWVN